MEKELFKDTSFKKVQDNLTKHERESLNKWRKDQLFNNDGTLVMRQQDKGNRFVIVDKTIDKIKANEQINRSSFRKLDYDPTNEHIEKVSTWAKKWFNLKEISKKWMDFIINKDANPAKNATMYKTHKQGTPVRLLTSGCNTPIENLSRFIEAVCSPLTESMKSRIKNTDHLLNIIDNINENGIPTGTILVSFDVINMFPSINN